MEQDITCVSVSDLTLGYGQTVLMEHVSFEVKCGDITVIMGPSGSGKSTLLRHLIGLRDSNTGDITYFGESFTKADARRRSQMLRQFGILYQGSALWGSMTLAENVAFPLQEYTRLSKSEIGQIVQLKLALVGLAGFEDYFPSELSGGMKKRAALARAIAADPKILFLDEPSAGLDPVSSSRLDKLIVQLRDYLGVTVIMVTHELDSILAIGDRAVYLDTEAKTVTAIGSPQELLKNPPNDRIHRFMTRSV